MPAPMTPLLALLSSDARRLARDRFLLGTSAYLLGVSVAMRWALPWASDALKARRGFSLEPHYPLLASYLFGILGAILLGTIGGFLLLESREEGSLRAVLVSPLSLGSYLAVGSAAAAAIAAGVILAEAGIVGLGLPPWRALIPIAAVAGLSAPVCALFLATFAANKVEAFAQMKFVSLAGLMPVAAAFLPPPWQYAAGLLPVFWPAKAWWVAARGGPGWAWWLLAGALIAGAALAILGRRFLTVVRR